jgi:hypothetical protein
VTWVYTPRGTIPDGGGDDNPDPGNKDPCKDETAVAFYKGHLSDAALLAKDLNFPVEFILAVSADESAFGESNIAKKAHNFFGIRAGGANALPEPFTTSGGAKVSQYNPTNGYLASGQDFVALEKGNPDAHGATDPTKFFTAMHDKFALGLTLEAYVSKMTSMEGLVAGRLKCP